MTLTLTLTPEKESALAGQARAAGMTLDDYVQRMVDLAAGETSGPDTSHRPTLAELLEGRIGTVEGPEDLSEDTGGKFARLMQEKHRAGRL